MQPVEVLLLFCLLLASGAAWCFAAIRVGRGRPILKFEPRRRVPWGAIDLVIAVFVLVILGAASTLWLRSQVDLTQKIEEMSGDSRALVLLSSAMATLLAAALTGLIVWLRTGARARDFGIDVKQIGRDLWLGVVAFFMLAAPVFMIQAALTIWWPSKHPLIELVKANPEVRFFLITGFSAVIVAPLAEEFLFRVLFQGWMERIPGFRGETSELILGGRTAQERKPVPEEQTKNDEPDSPASPDDDNPYKPPQAKASQLNAAESTDADETAQRAIWPIFVSAAVFALMHYSHGPDPIPLFVLAVGLGFLYHRTHRILPCIVVHFLLNSFSLAVLIYEVYS